MAWENYDRPFLNVSGEVIPPFAVMQLAGWSTDSHGLAVFNATKPTGNGKVFLLNGPSAVPMPTSLHTGMGFGTRAHGAYALFDEELDPELNQELGPVAGEWHLGDGSGFFVMGDVQGGPSSAPGFPSVPATFRVRVVMQPSAPAKNIIVGTILSDATEASATFVIVNVILIEGVDPTGGNPTVGVIIQNVPAEVREAGTQIRAEQSSTNFLWFPVSGSDVVASPIKRFEITADKGYADSQVLAKPVLPNGAMDTAADEVYLLDFPATGEPRGRWYGLKAFSDASGGGTHAGYRFDAVEITPNYESTGKAGYRVVAGEGPAAILVVTLVGEVTSGHADCNLDANVRLAVGPDSDRLPGIESAAYHLTVWDDLDVAGAAAPGAKWYAKWNRASERYVFTHPVPVATTGPVYGLLISTLPAATIPGGGTWEITPGVTDGAIVVLEWNDPPTKLVAQMDGGSAVIKRGLWRGKTPLRGSSTDPVGVVGRFIQFRVGAEDVECFWVDSEWDARGGVGYVHTSDQAFQKAANATPAWENTEECA